MKIRVRMVVCLCVFRVYVHVCVYVCVYASVHVQYKTNLFMAKCSTVYAENFTVCILHRQAIDL